MNHLKRKNEQLTATATVSPRHVSRRRAQHNAQFAHFLNLLAAPSIARFLARSLFCDAVTVAVSYVYMSRLATKQRRDMTPEVFALALNLAGWLALVKISVVKQRSTQRETFRQFIVVVVGLHDHVHIQFKCSKTTTTSDSLKSSSSETFAP